MATIAAPHPVTAIIRRDRPRTAISIAVATITRINAPLERVTSTEYELARSPATASVTSVKL